EFRPVCGIVCVPAGRGCVGRQHDGNLAMAIADRRHSARDAAGGGATADTAIVEPSGRQSESFCHIDREERIGAFAKWHGYGQAVDLVLGYPGALQQLCKRFSAEVIGRTPGLVLYRRLRIAGDDDFWSAHRYTTLL